VVQAAALIDDVERLLQAEPGLLAIGLDGGNPPRPRDSLNRGGRRRRKGDVQLRQDQVQLYFLPEDTIVKLRKPHRRDSDQRDAGDCGCTHRQENGVHRNCPCDSVDRSESRCFSWLAFGNRFTRAAALLPGRLRQCDPDHARDPYLRARAKRP
jgi:hypothetical protein